MYKQKDAEDDESDEDDELNFDISSWMKQNFEVTKLSKLHSIYLEHYFGTFPVIQNILLMLIFRNYNMHF